MRFIKKVITGHLVSDGAGVNIKRVIGLNSDDYIDPFLMFDDFRNDDPSGYIGGFPPHPHRGFETVTYMLKGRMRHRDSDGNSGLLADGDVQWMTAGKGILHSEMPEQINGSLWGFQIWVNLPQRLQMTEPRYQDIPAAKITEWEDDFGSYRLIAGQLSGRAGPAKTHLPVLMVDVAVNESETIIPICDGHTAILFCFDGSIASGDTSIRDGDLAVLSKSGELIISGRGRCLILAAEPLNESIAKHGPFVLSNQSELKQAFIDYQLGRLAPNQAAFLASDGHG